MVGESAVRLRQSLNLKVVLISISSVEEPDNVLTWLLTLTKILGAIKFVSSRLILLGE